LALMTWARREQSSAGFHLSTVLSVAIRHPRIPETALILRLNDAA
jgi:hypothetical protein